MARTSVVQNIEAERNALRDALRSGAEGGANNRYAAGTDVPARLNQDPALRQLLQEQVYTRAYGTGKPTFVSEPSRAVPTASRYSATPVRTPSAVQAPAQQQTAAPNGFQSIMDQINARYGASAGVDEEAIRQRSMSDLQKTIDSIKQRYVATINEAQRQGEGRLGQQRGLSTVSGTRFSPRGAAEQSNVESQNQAAINAINADMNAEINAATAAAEGLATGEIRYQGESAQKKADAYLSNMLSAYKLYQDQQSSEADQAARYAQLTGTLGGAPTLALRQYLSDTQNQSFQQDLSNRELQAKIAQAQQKNYSLSQLDDGTVAAFDPATGQMTVLGRYAKPQTYSQGSVPVSRGAAADIANAFSGRYGSDNYLDTSVYADQYRRAAAGGGAASFLKQYPVEAYLNPYDPTAIPFFGTNPSYPDGSATASPY